MKYDLQVHLKCLQDTRLLLSVSLGTARSLAHHFYSDTAGLQASAHMVLLVGRPT